MNGGQGSVNNVLIEGKKYACKRPSDGKSADEESKHRFLREIRIGQKTESRNVIPIVDFGEDEDGLFYIMPWYQQNLRQYIRKNRDLLFDNPFMQRDVFLSILNGVHALHSQGIIHRDLKPENVLMNSIEDVVICDFGFSKDLNSSGSYTTTTGDAFGTENYISPEQERDSKNVDARTDIYALGQILNDITGRGIRNIPDPLRRIADKATSYDREDRYGSVKEMIGAIRSGFKVWIRNKNGVLLSPLFDDVLQGKLDKVELISDVEQILNDPYYTSGNADKLLAYLGDEQYLVIENDSLDLCLMMFELIWDDWYSSWNGFDYAKIDDMSSLVKNNWSVSLSPEVKGYNLAKLADLAQKGCRFDAMRVMAEMIATASSDVQTKAALLKYANKNSIRDNYKKIGKQPPSWLL